MRRAPTRMPSRNSCSPACSWRRATSARRGATCASSQGDDHALEEAVEQGKKKFVGYELPGRTLGVVGLGAIGVEVANAALGLRMKVLGLRSADHRAARLAAVVGRRAGAQPRRPVRALPTSITVHVPLDRRTRAGSSTRRASRLMRRGSVILNFARGADRRRSGRARSARQRPALRPTSATFRPTPIKNHPQGRGAAAPRRVDRRGRGELRGHGGRHAARLPRERQRAQLGQFPRGGAAARRRQPHRDRQRQRAEHGRPDLDLPRRRRASTSPTCSTSRAASSPTRSIDTDAPIRAELLQRLRAIPGVLSARLVLSGPTDLTRPWPRRSSDAGSCRQAAKRRTPNKPASAAARKAGCRSRVVTAATRGQGAARADSRAHRRGRRTTACADQRARAARAAGRRLEACGRPHRRLLPAGARGAGAAPGAASATGNDGGPLRDEEILRLFREIMSACLAQQNALKIGYLGPEGTFTQQAVLKYFGHSVRPLPLDVGRGSVPRSRIRRGRFRRGADRELDRGHRQQHARHVPDVAAQDLRRGRTAHPPEPDGPHDDARRHPARLRASAVAGAVPRLAAGAPAGRRARDRSAATPKARAAPATRTARRRSPARPRPRSTASTCWCPRSRIARTTRLAFWSSAARPSVRARPTRPRCSCRRRRPTRPARCSGCSSPWRSTRSA